MKNLAVFLVCPTQLPLGFQSQNETIPHSIRNSKSMVIIFLVLTKRHRAGVACYVRNGLSFTKRNHLPHEIENPMAVGVIYRPPSQTSFQETTNEYFNKLNTIVKKKNMLGDFNINLY